MIPHRTDAFIHDFDVFQDFLAVAERSGGLRKIRIKPWSGAAERLIDADEAAYTAMLDTNTEIESDLLRYTYTSLTTPTTTYDYDMRSGTRTLLKRDPVPPPFDPANYRTEYLHAPARDGAQVPVSIVYRKDLKRDGTAPIFQYGYGSYGISMDPAFSASWVSLLDRGLVVAIAHVRGGQELGRKWYDDGRLLHKVNTFTDFIDVTDYLVREGWGARDKVVAHGGSAGGLLMGAIANMAPERYRAIIADVPFVDVVTTMLDESIPAHDGRVRRVGRSARSRVLRLHAVVFALRSGQRTRLSCNARDDRALGQPGAVLRAGEMGGEAARDEDRFAPAPVSHQHGSRSRGTFRPLPPLSGDGHEVRVCAATAWHQGRDPALSERCSSVPRWP